MTQSVENTVFRYSSSDLSVEIRGEESFVREQIECMGILERIAGALPAASTASAGIPAMASRAATAAATAVAPAPVPERAATTPAAALGEKETASAFFERCHARAGKGAHFDRVLLIGYWLEHIEGRKAFSKADIERTYEDIALDLPKHLDQVIGSIRRDHELFEQAGRVGRYRLTEAGITASRELGA